MFKDLDKAQERGAKTYETSRTLEGMVDIDHRAGIYEYGIVIGEDSLIDFMNEFVDCYGKKVKVEIKVTVNL